MPIIITIRSRHVAVHRFRAEFWEREAEIWTCHGVAVLLSLNSFGMESGGVEKVGLDFGSWDKLNVHIPGTRVPGAAVEGFLGVPSAPQSNFPDLHLTVCPPDHRAPRHVVGIAPLPGLTAAPPPLAPSSSRRRNHTEQAISLVLS